jgi:chaperonin GroES
MSVNVRLLDNRVLISTLQEETTAGGILIPTAAQQKSDTGVVKKVGQGKLKKDGTHHAMTVKEGDKVVYSKYSGTEIKIDGQDFIIVREDDIMGILG